MKIEKKVWPQFFQKIMEGKKNFELRLADWECREGDVLVLREYNPETKEYTGRTLEKEIKYVFRTKNQKFWPEKEVDKYGFLILGF